MVVVLPYVDEDDAVRVANNSSDGLDGSVWTTDPDRGRALAGRVHTGSVGINSYVADPSAPIGGVKNSGIGRELGPEGFGELPEPEVDPRLTGRSRTRRHPMPDHGMPPRREPDRQPEVLVTRMGWRISALRVFRKTDSVFRWK
ncbi:aldehyde dehydrogenase family protein [Amycolatopsis sp. NPDC005232]|uniref:aldehyde dehydrogenase family protein n=1 Tax=Amycolatopsis sp. NPDC005232 TaxID=3157027 RepID=UPI0033A0FCD3